MPTRRKCLHALARVLLSGPWKQSQSLKVARTVEVSVHGFSSTPSGYLERMGTKVRTATGLAQGLEVKGDDAEEMMDIIRELGKKR